MESENVKVDDLKSRRIKYKDNLLFDERIRNDYDDEEIQEIQEDESENEEEKEDEESPRQHSKAPSRRVQKKHPESQVIGNKSVGVETRTKLAYESELLACFTGNVCLSLMESTTTMMD